MSQVALTQMTQLRATLESFAEKAASGPTQSQPAPYQENGTGRSFSNILNSALNSVSTIENHAHLQAQAYEFGAANVSLNDVMVNLQKANLAMQTTVQMRNRLVAAYQEIASMSI